MPLLPPSPPHKLTYSTLSISYFLYFSLYVNNINELPSFMRHLIYISSCYKITCNYQTECCKFWLCWNTVMSYMGRGDKHSYLIWSYYQTAPVQRHTAPCPSYLLHYMSGMAGLHLKAAAKLVASFIPKI